jgi:hypothetical protein
MIKHIIKGQTVFLFFDGEGDFVEQIRDYRERHSGTCLQICDMLMVEGEQRRPGICWLWPTEEGHVMAGIETAQDVGRSDVVAAWPDLDDFKSIEKDEV